MDAALTWPSLLAAARRARLGKRYQPEVLAFHARETDNLLQLREQLLAETWQPGTPRIFHISQPKPRIISAAPYSDRVVHQVLCAPLERLFDERLHPGCMANRKGLGVDAALRFARREMQRNTHVLSLDMRGYFGSIDHQVLNEGLERWIKDARYLRVLACIINKPAPCAAPGWFFGDDLLAAARPRGIAIGNLTSQHFGNHYLHPLDHALSEIGLRHVRYVDDLLIFGPRRELIRAWALARQVLQRLRIQLNTRKCRVQPTAEPIKFLGMMLAANGQVWAASQSARRWRRPVCRGMRFRGRSALRVTQSKLHMALIKPQEFAC